MIDEVTKILEYKVRILSPACCVMVLENAWYTKIIFVEWYTKGKNRSFLRKSCRPVSDCFSRDRIIFQKCRESCIFFLIHIATVNIWKQEIIYSDLTPPWPQLDIPRQWVYLYFAHISGSVSFGDIICCALNCLLTPCKQSPALFLYVL